MEATLQGLLSEMDAEESKEAGMMNFKWADLSKKDRKYIKRQLKRSKRDIKKERIKDVDVLFKKIDCANPNFKSIPGRVE